MGFSRRSEVGPPRLPNFWRGNCPCGKWLVLVPGEPMTCHGPCSGERPCGRVWKYDGKEATFSAPDGV